MCPSDCWVQMVIPFDKNEKLRDRYCLLDTNTLRTGLLMELLDYFSAMIAYKYVNCSTRANIYTLVTGSVDKFEIAKKKIHFDKSLVLIGYPNWNSHSSIDVRIDLVQNSYDNINKMSNQDECFLGSSNFLYVARDSKDYSKKKVCS